MAKSSRLYCCLAAIFLFLSPAFQLGAQTFTAPLEPHTSLALAQNFSQYQVFRLDAKLLEAHVKSNLGSPAELNIGGHHWRLSLEPNRIISENYSLRVSTPNGVVVSYSKPNIAFKGYELNGGGMLRLTIRDEFLYGFVEEGSERYYIEPLWYYEPLAERDLFVVYHQSAANTLAPNACGMTEAQIELERLEESYKGGSAENSACYELEIAVASDRSMYDKYGSVPAVEDHNIGVLNDVQGDYTGGNFDHDIEYVIVTQFVVTGSDPWTPSTDAGVLLASFRNWGNGGNFGVNFDNGELWTNRNFDGATVGIAYLAGICNSNKYHCLQDYTGNANSLRVLTSHELGHNWSSGHDAGCPPPQFIMCPSVSQGTSWSDQSTNAISAYIQSKINSGCLQACGPPPPPLIAGFDWSPKPGCQGQPVTFTDQSSGNITNWAWTFPGGTPSSSNQQNPAVTWNTPGFKDVTLTITGQGGSNAITQSIEIGALPAANFTFAVNGLEVTFTNTSTDATSYEWDFGDGGGSTDEDPVYEYPQAGTYVVVLKATNSCGQSIKSIIVNTAPTAFFEASPTNGCATLVVQMDNQSSSNSVTYNWTFPGGAPSASNQANPSVIYALAGTYPITLKATNGSGSNTFTRTDYITVKTTPTANFNFTVNGSTATFTNISIGNATSYLWNFGDGDTSTLANPVHVYSNPGIYDVVLTATNDCGSSTKTRQVEIVSSGPPTAAFTANPSSGCAPLTVNFTNNTTGAVSYLWTFPGGTPDSSTVTNPTVVYSTPGSFTATLIATNVIGSDTTSAVITVNTVPDAGFTYAVSNDTTVTFTNTSTGATSYLWTFGDGDSSIVANPVHDYPAHDSIYVYQVILQAINACGTVNDTQLVTIVTDPQANFTATTTSGCAPLTVQFNNTSTPNATSFLWRFPGGTPDSSILKNPVIVYATPGTYSVTLIAINAAGRDTFTRTNYIVVNTTPVAGFTSAANGLTVNFTNTTSGATSYSWDFGDNSNSTDANPSHTYATDGTYTVILSATNTCGTVTKTQTVTVATTPTAGFTASATSGCAPLTVQFTNTSSANSTNFDWQFPGGNPSSSTAQNPPSVEYALPGTYTVTLTASNSAGSSTFTQVIVVNAGPTANFSSNVSVLTATFTNNSTNGLAYNWDFGDGSNNSSDPNPTHEYAADGTYTVVLTATNNCGSSTFTQTVVITTEPGAGFSVSTTSGCAVLTVNFTDISSGNPVSWEWDFPGGTPSSSTEKNPTVQYFTPGVYDVTLVVTSIGGSTSSFTQPGIITVNSAPSAGFTSSVNDATVTFANTSVGATSYIWTFGDQSSSLEENPTHTYANDGVYTVILIATNNCGSTIFEQTVVVVTPPTAGFSVSSASGCVPFSVQFTNTSSSNATTFAWEFPGGNPSTSSDPNPIVTWNTAGVYTVTLTASNSAGSSTSTTTITVGVGPTPGFTYQIGGLTAVFTNTSSNGDSYLWDFGDGSDTSTDVNPNHTYTQPDSYTVTLSVTNECGTVTITQTVVVEGTPPVPAISANNTNGCLPFSTQFTDQSAGDPTAWIWTFQGGTPATSTDQNPSVTFAAPGTYDVTLEVTNIFGSSTEVFPAYITVQTAPTAGFTYVANQTTVTFTSTSQNATTYFWSFGDLITSDEENPSHTYAAPGTYTVSLATSNNCGTTIIEQTVVITSGTGEAAWIKGFNLFPNPNSGAFTVEMNGLPQDEVEFTLFNALGQQIKRETADFGSGSLLRSFDYGDLAAGVYTFCVQADGQAMFVKVTVGR
ncbi:MAG: PKD domain-containing protein [Saprospiraceae bacterium]|nr:PKD domain-containing protein [Saprospiraceae bacterium]